MDRPAPISARRRRLNPLVVAAPLLAIGLVLSSGGLRGGPDQVGDPGASGSTSNGPSATDASPIVGPGPTATVAAPSGPSGRPTLSPDPTMSLPPVRAPGDYLLMTRAALLARPTSGPAWDALLADASGPTGRPALDDQNVRHGVTTLAAALVYARTGDVQYQVRAQQEVMAAIGTEREGADNSILALGRQLGAYVLAADFAGLSGDDDRAFRAWLDDIRTRRLGGHGRWTTLSGTHQDAPNNWGSFSGASRIAAGLYLGDQADVARAAQVLRGFLGDRTAWDAFQPVDDAASWACDPTGYVPLNPPCTRGGIDLDGAIVRDIDRGGNRRWPPGRAGIGYTLESLQGLILQAELLTRNGYGDAWTWSDSAIRRASGIVTRSGEAGGLTWNRSAISQHVPWLLNARYGLDLPTMPAGQGRIFGYTDWLYGP